MSYKYTTQYKIILYNIIFYNIIVFLYNIKFDNENDITINKFYCKMI